MNYHPSLLWGESNFYQKHLNFISTMSIFLHTSKISSCKEWNFNPLRWWFFSVFSPIVFLHSSLSSVYPCLVIRLLNLKTLLVLHVCGNTPVKRLKILPSKDWNFTLCRTVWILLVWRKINDFRSSRLECQDEICLCVWLEGHNL